MAIQQLDISKAFENTFFVPIKMGEIVLEEFDQSWVQKLSGKQTFRMTLTPNSERFLEETRLIEQLEFIHQFFESSVENYIINEKSNNITIESSFMSRVLEFSKDLIEEFVEEARKQNGGRKEVFDSWLQKINNLKSSGLIANFFHHYAEEEPASESKIENIVNDVVDEWNEQEPTHFDITLDKQQTNTLRQVLRNALFGIEPGLKELGENSPTVVRGNFITQADENGR